MSFELQLRNIRFNKKSGYYQITEAAAEYQIPPDLINNLARFLDTNNSMIVCWYEDLDEFSKSRIRVRDPFRIYD